MKPVKNILVLTYWSYQEALIQSYTLPYVRIMRKNIPASKKIFLFTLEKKENELIPSEKQKAKTMLSNEGIIWIDFNYSKFNIITILKLAAQITRLISIVVFKRVSHLHCWCTPAGAIGYLISIFTNSSLIIDSYEPHAEAMVENGEWKKGSLAFKILWKLEKLQTRKAECIISATAGMRQYMKEKYQAEKDHFYVKPACVNLALFSQQNIKNKVLLEAMNLQGKIIAVYAGKIGGIYLKQELFDFLKVAADYWGKNFHVLMLSNHHLDEIRQLCATSNFPLDQLTLKFVPHHEIPDYMGLGDFAITPVKPIPTKKYCTPIKDGEYWALGLPVVITKDISDDSEIIRKYGVGSVIELLEKASYERSVREIYDILTQSNRAELYQKIRNIAIEFRSFKIAEDIYKKIYFHG